MQNQQYDQAFAYVAPFYEADTTQLELLVQMAHAKRLGNDLRHAERLYRRVIAQDTAHMFSQYQLGALLYKRLQTTEAKDHLNKAYTLDSNQLQVNLLLAQIYMAESDTLHAFTHYNKAHQLQPSNVDLALNFVDFCIDFDYIDEADSLLRVMMLQDPENPLVLLAMVDVYVEREDLKNLIPLCKHLIDLGHGDNSVNLIYARSLFRHQEFESALKKFKQLHLDDHRNVGELDLYYMSLTAKALGDLNQAVVYMDSVLSRAISGNAGFYHGIKAEMLTGLNKPSRAIETYQRGLTFEPNPIFYYEMAQIYETQMPNPAAALRQYQTFLKQTLTPNLKPFVDYSEQRVKQLTTQMAKK
jgi:tetratricopeptide (TPR) repeat protein